MFALEDNHTSRRRPLRVAVALWSAVALAGLSAIALRHVPSPKPEVLVPQTTTTIVCAETVMTSIVVANDLSCPSGAGLNVGVAGITINLNGHTLAGNTGWYGIHDHGVSAVIENGTVSGWLVAVDASGPASKVTGIRATAGWDGLIIHGPGTSATGNVVFGNSNSGIKTGSGAKVTSNVVRENSSFGIYEGGGAAVVQANQVENNGSDGIRDEGSGATLSGNVTNGNAGDGIKSAADPRATVTSNTANYDGAYGIEASAGGKDGGGNTAKGNTTAAQCKNIVCG